MRKKNKFKKWQWDWLETTSRHHIWNSSVLKYQLIVLRMPSATQCSCGWPRVSTVSKKHTMQIYCIDDDQSGQDKYCYAHEYCRCINQGSFFYVETWINSRISLGLMILITICSEMNPFTNRGDHSNPDSTLCMWNHLLGGSTRGLSRVYIMVLQ